MAQSLQFVPPRVPLCDLTTGTITREWYLFLQGVYLRVGGATGESTSELNAGMFEDAGVEELKAGLYQANQDVNQSPLNSFNPVADDPLIQIQALADQLAEIVKDIQALRQSTLI